MKLANEKEKTDWMNERMKKGYSFVYIKGTFNDIRINVSVKCIDTEEAFDFEWSE